MYIEPNSVVNILRGVEADRDFKNVKYFASRSAQEQYMWTKIVKSFPRLSYVRDNQIKVEGTADAYYNCNYLMFKNQSFGNKWFYAFIDEVRYNNNNTCTINFTIDNYQTWFLDCQIGQCFVEREHVVDDSMFLHTLDEGLGTDELNVKLEAKMTDFTSNVVYCVEFVLNDAQMDGLDTSDVVLVKSSQTRGHVVNGCSYAYSAHSDNIVAFAQSIIEAGYANSVQGIYSIPTSLGLFNNSGQFFTSDYDVPDLPNNIDGYTPRNNKLYCYPFSCYNIYVPNGNSMVLRPELFDNTKKIKFRGNLGMRPTVMATPYGYKGFTDVKTMGVTCDYGVLGSFSYDSYQAMIASYGLPTGMAEISRYVAPALTGSLSAITTGDPVKGIVGTVGSLFGAYSQNKRDTHDRTSLSGSYGTNVLWQTDIQEFYIQVKQVRRELAESIDNFFDMFGYRVNTIKVPNISARPSWNYVKCQTFVANGNIPSDVDEFFKNMFLQGVTFWKTTMGDYSVANK